MLYYPYFESRQNDKVVVGVLDEHRVATCPGIPGQAEGGRLVTVACAGVSVRATVPADVVDHLVDSQTEVVSLIEPLDQREVGPGEVKAGGEPSVVVRRGVIEPFVGHIAGK